MKDANTKVVYCGIDVSKTSFDGYCQGRSFKFKNEYQGYRKLIDMVKDKAVHYVMEATGPYYLSLAVYLYQQGFKVSVINPLVIKRFSQMRMIRAKTDKADAKLITLYAEKEVLKLWSPPNPILHEIAQLQATIDLLGKQDRMLKNQLESVLVQPFQSKKVINTLRFFIKKLDDKIQQLEQGLLQKAEQHFNKQLALITSIPGIGIKTGITLLVITNGFTKFDSSKQLASYTGICPRIYQSGTSVKGKGHITKMGNNRLRSMLYVASWSAVQYR